MDYFNEILRNGFLQPLKREAPTADRGERRPDPEMTPSTASSIICAALSWDSRTGVVVPEYEIPDEDPPPPPPPPPQAKRTMRETTLTTIGRNVVL